MSTKTKTNYKLDLEDGKYAGVDWNGVLWGEFHKQFPSVSRASFYNYKASLRDEPPDIIASNVVVESQKCDSLSNVQSSICEAIQRGELESQAVEMNGVSIAQHIRWMNDTKSSAYSEIVKKSLQVAKMRLKDGLVKNITDWSKRQWTSSAWLLERMWPSEFGRDGKSNPGGNASVIVNLNVRTRSGAKDITTSCNISTQTPDSGAIATSQEPQEGLQDAG